MKRLIACVALLTLAVAPVSADPLFRSGYELQSAAEGVEWYSGDTLPATGTISTTIKRSGDASFCVSNPASGTVTGRSVRFVSSGVNGTFYYFRDYIYIDTAPGSTTAVMAFGTTGNGGLGRVNVHSDRGLSMQFDTGGSLESVPASGSGAMKLSLATWYRVEIYIFRNATTPNSNLDAAELRIDGVTQSDVTDTSLSISAVPNRALVGMNLLGSETNTSGTICHDDVAINDSNGSTNNSWPGAGSIVTLFPNGDGEYNSGAVVTGATNPWEAVDDGILTGTVDETDYVTLDTNTTSWTAGSDRFAVAMTDLPSASAVNVVILGARVATNGSLPSQYSIGVQTSNGGSDSTATPASFASWSDPNRVWVLNYPTTTRAIAHANAILQTKPGGGAWTETDVDSLQMQMRSDDGSPSISVTSMWATVEYTPDGGGGPPPPGGAGPCLMALLNVGRCAGE